MTRRSLFKACAASFAGSLLSRLPLAGKAAEVVEVAEAEVPKTAEAAPAVTRSWSIVTYCIYTSADTNQCVDTIEIPIDASLLQCESQWDSQ